ncbi:MAG TPA: hypothetical protein GXZ45_04625 [Propionibacterium sp.]|nr:hypothetical protein [Propionibacterium sp.]
MKSIQKIGLGLGATALVLGGTAGFASLAHAADPTPATATCPNGGQPNQNGQGWANGRGGQMRGEARGGQQAAVLAEKLDIDEAKVTEALQTAHDALREAHQADADGTRPTLEERRAELATELAKALGIDGAQVTEALTVLDAEREAIREARGGGGPNGKGMGRGGR